VANSVAPTTRSLVPTANTNTNVAGIACLYFTAATGLFGKAFPGR
jgi:hypothetical protein